MEKNVKRSWVCLVPSLCKVGNGFVPGPLLVGFGAFHLAEKHAFETTASHKNVAVLSHYGCDWVLLKAAHIIDC